MNSKTKNIFTFLHVITWIIFVGLCIKAGTLFVTTLFSIYLPHKVDILYKMEESYTAIEKLGGFYYTFFMIIVFFLTLAKARLFYWLILIFSTMNLENPFDSKVVRNIEKIGTESIFIAIIAIFLQIYVKYLHKQNFSFQYQGEGMQFLLLAAVIFILTYIFKKGMKLQSEQELTI